MKCEKGRQSQVHRDMPLPTIWESQNSLESLELQPRIYGETHCIESKPKPPGRRLYIRNPDPPTIDLDRRGSSGTFQSIETSSTWSTSSFRYSLDASHRPLDLLPLSSRACYRPELYPDQPTCKVCRRDFLVVPDKCLRKLHCGHIFHRCCIDLELNGRDVECPSCRSRVPDAWYGQPMSQPREGFKKWGCIMPALRSEDRNNPDPHNQNQAASENCAKQFAKSQQR